MIDSPIAVTMSICPDEALAQLESVYLAILESAEIYAIQGDRLTVSGPEGEIVFAANRQPLLGTYWKLISLGDAGRSAAAGGGQRVHGDVQPSAHAAHGHDGGHNRLQHLQCHLRRQSE